MIISEDIKFILKRGDRFITGGGEYTPFSHWYPRSKFLDNRISAEKHALDILKI